MKKADMISAISEAADITKAQATQALDTLTDIVTGELAAGGESTLAGIGKLSVTVRSARTGRNPQTGEPIDIPASKGVRFKAVKALKDAVNQ